MWAGNRHTLASHIALHLDGRPRPEGASALHSCDNPGCVNPAHLRWGTQAENIQDRVSRKRNGAAYGIRNASTKLSADEAREIFSDKRALKEIALDFGVSAPAVRAIKTGKTWRTANGLDAEACGQTALSEVQPHAKEQG